MKALQLIFLVAAVFSIPAFLPAAFAQGSCDPADACIREGNECGVGSRNCDAGYSPVVTKRGLYSDPSCTQLPTQDSTFSFCSCRCIRTGYTLTVSKSGSGSGTVTGAGINCGGDCTETYNRGDNIGYSYSPASDSEWAGWGDACTDFYDCVITFDSDKTLTATFNSKLGTQLCGNGVCDSGESPSTCPGDCRSADPCGNGRIDPGEECDTNGPVFPSGTSCQTFGYQCGSLYCDPNPDDRGRKCQIVPRISCSNSCGPTDVCSGVSCPDKCDNGVWKTGGTCSAGACSYGSSENCDAKDGWYTDGGQFRDGECTKQRYERRDYSCSGSGCQYNVVERRTDTVSCESDSDAPEGWIDYPNGHTVSGTIYASGWALDKKSTVSSVTVHVDNFNSFARDYSTSTCGSRGDICNAIGAPYSAYSSCTDRCSAGWSAGIDTSQMPDGSYDVTARACDSKGNCRDLSGSPRRMTVSNPTCSVSFSSNVQNFFWVQRPSGAREYTGLINSYSKTFSGSDVRGTWDMGEANGHDANLDVSVSPGGSQSCSSGSVNWRWTYTEKARLSLSKTSISFNAVQGGSPNPSSDSLTVTNTGAGTLSWNAAESPDVSWLSISRTSGTEGAGGSSNPPITVTPNIAGMSAGSYSTTIRVTSNGGNQDVSVSLFISPPATCKVTVRTEGKNGAPARWTLQTPSGSVSQSGTSATFEGPRGVYDVTNIVPDSSSLVFDRKDPSGSQDCSNARPPDYAIGWTLYFKDNPVVYGDGTISGSEQCDSSNLNGQTCASQGFSGGTLKCNAPGVFDTSSCFTDTTSPLGFIDEPGRTIKGSALAGGWSLDASGVRSVVVQVRKTDGTVSRDYSTSTCGSRPDVCSTDRSGLSSYSACGGDTCRSGWNTLIDTTQLPQGTYNFYGYACDNSGNCGFLSNSPKAATVDQCYQVTCTNPPAAACSGNTLVSYSSPGTCVANAGTCNYPSTTENCRYGCSNAACNPNTGPSVSVSHSPASPGTATEVTISASATDIDGVASTTIFVDGAQKKTCAGASCTYASAFAYGAHTYYATSTDSLGLSSQSGMQNFATNDAPVVTGPVTYSGSCSTGSSITLRCNTNDPNQATSSLNVKVWAGQCVGSNCFNTRSWATGSGMTYHSNAQMNYQSGDTFVQTLTINQPAGTAIAATCRTTDERGAQNLESQGDVYPLCVVDQCNNPPLITIDTIRPNPARAGTLTIGFTADRALQGDPIVTVRPGSQSGGIQDVPAAFVSKSGNSYTYSFDVQGGQPNGIADISIRSHGQNCPAGKVDNTLVIDTVAPVTTALCNGAPCTGRVYNGQATVRLSCSDATTSCASTFYSVNGGNAAAYSPASPIALEDGTHTIRFWSADAAGNVESAKMSTIRVYAGNEELVARISLDRRSALVGETVNAKFHCFLRDKATKRFTRECNLDPNSVYITIDKGTPLQKNYFTSTGITPNQFLSDSRYYYTNTFTPITYEQYQYTLSKEWRFALDTNIFQSEVCGGGTDQDTGLGGEGCDGFSVSSSQLLSNTTFPDVTNLVVPLTPSGNPNFTKTMPINFQTKVSVRTQFTAAACQGADCSVNFSFLPFDQWSGTPPLRTYWDDFTKSYVPNAADVGSNVFACDTQRTLFIRATKLTGSDAGISTDETRDFFINCNIRATVNPSERRFVVGDTPGKVFDVTVWNPKEGADRAFSMESTTTNPEGYPLAWINFDCAGAAGCSVDPLDNDKATLTVPQVSSRTVQVHMPSAVRSGSFPVVFQATDNNDSKKYSATGTILIFAESLDEFAAWQLAVLGAAAVAAVYFALGGQKRMPARKHYF